MNANLFVFALFAWQIFLPASQSASVAFPAPVAESPSSATTGCSFPAYLIARQSWEKNILASRGLIGMVWKFDVTIAQSIEISSNSMLSYSCVDSTSADATGNTILVRVASVAPDANNDVGGGGMSLASGVGFFGYQCFRFVKRSQYVVQMWKSTMSAATNPTINLCKDLVLDQSPLIYSTLDDEDSNVAESSLVPTDAKNVGGTGCALVGGYTFTLQPPSGGAGSALCLGIPLPPVMESACGGTEGQPSVSIDFRQWFCAGRTGLPLTSTLYCLGSWSDPASNYTFSVVAADGSQTKSKLWLFRWPLSVPTSRPFVGHVSTEISTATDAQMTPSSSKSVAYAVNMTPANYGADLCSDESPSACSSTACSSSLSEPGLSLAKTSCQKTCSTCSRDSGSFASCKLTGGSALLAGAWSEVSSNSRRQRTITVGAQSITFGRNSTASASTMIANCANFTTGPQANFVGQRFPVVTVYPSTGCRPRYACIELIQRSQSVMTYRVGKALLWPYVPSLSMPSPLGADMLCAYSMFQASSPSTPSPLMTSADISYLDSSHDIRAVISRSAVDSGYLSSVSCGLPQSGWLLLNGQLPNGQDITATIDQCNSTRRSDLFRYTSSTTGVGEFHQCIATYTDQSTEDYYLITRNIGSAVRIDSTGDGDDSFFCWLFLHRALYGIPNQIFLTKASDCNANTALRVRSAGFGGYVASFQVDEPIDDRMAVGLFDSVTPVLRSCNSYNLAPAFTTPSATTTTTRQPVSSSGRPVDGGSSSTASVPVVVISTTRTSSSSERSSVDQKSTTSMSAPSSPRSGPSVDGSNGSSRTGGSRLAQSAVFVVSLLAAIVLAHV